MSFLYIFGFTMDFEWSSVLIDMVLTGFGLASEHVLSCHHNKKIK